jgi:hypothetical protein
MRFNTAPLPYCRCCGADVHKAIREVNGEKVETDPNFCRKCGYSFMHFVRVRGGGSRIRSVPDVEEAEIDDLDDDPWFDDLADFETLEEAIRQAVPENYKELPLEELQRQIIGSLWKRYTGIYPYRTPEQQAAIDRQHEEVLQQCIAAGTPPGMILNAPWSRQDESLKASVQSYHLVWVNGLIKHLSAAPIQMEHWRAEFERNLYKIEPCDCDKVKYVPDETHPRFLRKVEES